MEQLSKKASNCGEEGAGPGPAEPFKPKQVSMWGLIAMEEIPAGVYMMQYLGEIVTKKQGDMRGTFYDANGLSYLFDLNDPDDY